MNCTATLMFSFGCQVCVWPWSWEEPPPLFEISPELPPCNHNPTTTRSSTTTVTVPTEETDSTDGTTDETETTDETTEETTSEETDETTASGEETEVTDDGETTSSGEETEPTVDGTVSFENKNKIVEIIEKYCSQQDTTGETTTSGPTVIMH